MEDDLWIQLAKEEAARYEEAREAAQAEAFMFWMIIVAVWVLSCLGGLIVGAKRGRAGAGFLCGFVLGPVGVVASLFLPKGEKEQIRPPGSPVKRSRAMPVKVDPLEAWEAKERAKTLLEVPEHLRGKKFED